MAAGERRHQRGHIRLAPQRDAGQLQAGRPPLGARHQRRHRVLRQLRPDRLAQQRRGLGRGETQLGGAHLRQLAAGPPPRHRQQRVGTTGQHQMQPLRQVVEQESHRTVHLLGLDEVVVIEDQQHLPFSRVRHQLVDQPSHQPFERRRCGRTEQRNHPLGDPGPYPVQRGRSMPPKPGRIVVTGVKRQPGNRPRAAMSPVRQ